MKFMSFASLASFASLVVVGVTSGDVRAQVTDFASCPADLGVCDADTSSCCVRSFDPVGTDRAVIIAMDRCHQVIAQGGELAPPANETAPRWCADAGPFSANDNGMYEA